MPDNVPIILLSGMAADERLFERYSEDPDMSKELQEYARERIKELLKDMPPEKRLEGLPVKERLKGLSPEERLEGLSPEELEAMEVLIRQRKANGSSAKPQ